MNKNFACALCALILITLAGCGSKQRILKPIKKEKAHFLQQQNNVELRVRVLTPAHCQQQLGNTPRYSFRSKNPEILQCTVINKSDKAVTFAHNNTTLQLLNQKEVYEVIKKCRVLRNAAIAAAIFIGLPVLACLPALLTTPVGCCCPCAKLVPLLICCSAVIFAGFPIIAASIPCYLVERKDNNKISYTIRQKVPEKITIAPNSTQNFLLFAHALASPFTITLTREQQESITFNVQLPDSCLCTKTQKPKQKIKIEKKHDS